MSYVIVPLKALTHLVYMPYAYAVDKFKWDVFSSAVPEEDLNCHWVKLRMDVQGKLTIRDHVHITSARRGRGEGGSRICQYHMGGPIMLQYLE